MHSDSKALGRQLAVAAVLVLTLAGPACAVDGVIEINQVRAVVGGVTTGDEPGFPVTISQSGSYRLTGNLTVSDADTTAVLITADQVTVDLNGFAIVGPGGTGAGVGIDGRQRMNVTVMNGAIRGMGSTGIWIGRSARIESVHATNNQVGLATGTHSVVVGNLANENGNSGMSVGGTSTVIRNTASSNGGNGISCNQNCAVRDNVATGNVSSGINAGGNSTVSGNTANVNSTGIEAGDGSTVVGNTVNNNHSAGISARWSAVSGNLARGNTSVGLSLTSGGFGSNVLDGNNGGNANPQVTGGIQMGPNVLWRHPLPVAGVAPIGSPRELRGRPAVASTRPLIRYRCDRSGP